MLLISYFIRRKCVIITICLFISFFVTFTYFYIPFTASSNLIYQLNDRLKSVNLWNGDDVALIDLEDDEDSTPKPKPINKVIKTILLWNRLPGVMNSFLGTGSDGFLRRYGCEVTDCHVEDGQNKQQQRNRSMDSYDAVVFNMNILIYSDKLPWTADSYSRSPKQRFVFLSQEPPVHTWPQRGRPVGFVNKTEVNLYVNYFNWSMTYRYDSDVHLFYGSFKPKQGRDSSLSSTNATILKRNATTAAVANESIVAWMASHCPTDSRREDYARQLKRYIGVDAYGGCGNLRCAKDSRANGSPERCYDMIESKYKFYLSFENSICTAYVTEKFFQIMTRNVVPIVYGGADYSRIAPPHSYIDARQFEDPKQLADYLLLLDKNDFLYNEYFAWKEKYVVVSGQEDQILSGFCNLCRKLHDDNKPKVYSQLVNQWLPENQCKSPKAFN